MGWPNFNSGCKSLRHSESDCLVKRMVDKRFVWDKWCEPCKKHYPNAQIPAGVPWEAPPWATEESERSRLLGAERVAAAVAEAREPGEDGQAVITPESRAGTVGAGKGRRVTARAARVAALKPGEELTGEELFPQPEWHKEKYGVRKDKTVLERQERAAAFLAARLRERERRAMPHEEAVADVRARASELREKRRKERQDGD